MDLQHRFETKQLTLAALLLAVTLLHNLPAAAQPDFYKNHQFTKADTLRGKLSPPRACYDVTFYDISLAVDVEKKYIKGHVDIHFKAVESFKLMQIDLHRSLQIEKITFYDQPIRFDREFDAVFVSLPLELPAATEAALRIHYDGFPQVAKNAPWDGGFVWTKDMKGRPWAGVACEGDGASLWWPCKDHLSDEPDSASITVAVAPGLTAVSNGNLREVKTLPDGNRQFHWFVSYPINNYNISVGIGHYAHFTDTWLSAQGDSLALDYYVQDYNQEKAREHFRQVKPMLSCYERYFGPYPFPQDGFAMVETPYLGMEHQSGIAYGNRYNRGYLGGMIPEDMNWDFIIIHESGHEWFGNAVSVKDHCDMWIHESFTTYMEALYVECMYSHADAVRYLEGQRPFIRNAEPLLGPRDVNWDDWKGSDHYYKGSWMLHTLRSAVQDDDRFFGMLRGFYNRYKYSTCTTDDFIGFANQYLGRDFTAFFEQYLWHREPPRLEYELTQKGRKLKVRFRWADAAPGFDMPVLAGKPGAYQLLQPVVGSYREVVLEDLKKEDFKVAKELFYVR